MHLLEWLAEQKLAKAASEGAFDDLPGVGKPLDLDDDRLVPPDVRMAYRILKNAGFVPAEVEARKESVRLRTLIAASTDDAARQRAVARLALIETTLERRGGGLRGDGRYFDKLVARFNRAG
jgi:hypothetical protein